MAPMGFTVCTVSDILCPQAVNQSEETFHVFMEKQTMVET